MKVEMRNVSPCRVKLIIKADAAETHADVEAVMGRYMRDGRVKGFRAGKAPRTVIEREYRQDIDGDIRRRLINTFSRRAVEEHKLTLVAMVDATDILFSPETGISFVLLCDVAPEFKLPKYLNIPVKKNEPAVDDAEVERHLALIRNQISKYVDSQPDGVVAPGDVARIDFSAVSNGKPLKDLAEEAAVFSEGAGFWMQVIEPEMIPGVSLALAGMKTGEEKIIQTQFPKDFRIAALQGVKAVYTVKLAGFRQMIPATDEAVCQQFGVADLDTLRTQLRAQMQRQAESDEKSRRQQEVIDYLLKKTDFDLPESEMAQETNATVQTMLRGIIKRGGTREDLEKHRDQLLTTATNTTKDRLRLRYILARIGEDAEVQVTDDELQKKLDQFAAQHQMSPREMRERIEKGYGIETFRADVRNEMTLEFLVNAAKG
jgi:trigger factor